MIARHPKDNFRKITSDFPKVDMDGKEIDPQAVMVQVSPYACRLARLIEMDEFVKDEVAPEDVGKEYLAFEVGSMDPLLDAENLPPVSSVVWVLQDPAPEPEDGAATLASRRFMRVDKSFPASSSAPSSA